MKSTLRDIVHHFDIAGDFLGARILPWGHINETYWSLFSEEGGERRYIHQRINHKVFRDPKSLMKNIERVTAHLRRKISAAGGDPRIDTNPHDASHISFTASDRRSATQRRKEHKGTNPFAFLSSFAPLR